eukprot:Phypoly_transcript_13299.p1 GENE.Phypoly_transcript_13299~~Phypoly_transcript_13299.p1  ORF type:complete len:298 (+),score=33.05 Phypoly_transcript_13299:139-1032(+)
MESSFLIILVLFAFVAPSFQQTVGISTSFQLVNGTQVVWPRVPFNISGQSIPFPEVYVSYNATLYANSSISIKTEFFDVNTSAVIDTFTPADFQYRGYAGSSASYQTAIKVPPCNVVRWNTINRFIGARNVIVFQSTANINTSMIQTIKVAGTLLGTTSGTLTSDTVAKYLTFQTPASTKNSTSQYQVNITLQQVQGSLPFSDYCVSQSPNCNCIAQGKIGFSTNTVNISATLPPSGTFFLQLSDNPGTSDVLFKFTTQMTEIFPPPSTTGRTSTGMKFYLPVWEIFLLALAMVALI